MPLPFFFPGPLCQRRANYWFTNRRLCCPRGWQIAQAWRRLLFYHFSAWAGVPCESEHWEWKKNVDGLFTKSYSTTNDWWRQTRLKDCSFSVVYRHNSRFPTRPEKECHWSRWLNDDDDDENDIWSLLHNWMVHVGMVGWTKKIDYWRQTIGRTRNITEGKHWATLAY